MLGWEYPPKISGGLGIASQGLAESLAKLGHEVVFILPKASQISKNGVLLVSASGIAPIIKEKKIEKETKKLVNYLELGTRLLPYIGKEHFKQVRSQEISEKKLSIEKSIELLKHITLTGGYGTSLFDEIAKYAYLVSQFALENNFDIVHCHDWMTFKAGEAIKKLIDIPIVLHVHSTEIERNGGHAHQEIREIEQVSCKMADLIFTVSDRTANILKNSYGINEDRISVIPNGYDAAIKPIRRGKRNRKLLGFAGRLTHQKNPKKFLDLARLLKSKRNDLSFTIVGDGYLMEEIRNQIHDQNLEKDFTLTGFLTYKESIKAISGMDLLLVTSGVEPFGLVPLEAIRAKVPVLTAEGCGIAEFIPSLMTLKPWDEYGWVNTIDRLLNDPDQLHEMAERCYHESNKLSWDHSANLTISAYKTLI